MFMSLRNAGTLVVRQALCDESVGAESVLVLSDAQLRAVAGGAKDRDEALKGIALAE
jgi:hypothetical protein